MASVSLATWFACDGERMSVSDRSSAARLAHLLLHRIDDLLEVLGQDVTLGVRGRHALVLLCQFGVNSVAEGCQRQMPITKNDGLTSSSVGSRLQSPSAR